MAQENESANILLTKITEHVQALVATKWFSLRTLKIGGQSFAYWTPLNGNAIFATFKLLRVFERNSGDLPRRNSTRVLYFPLFRGLELPFSTVLCWGERLRTTKKSAFPACWSIRLLTIASASGLFLFFFSPIAERNSVGVASVRACSVGHCFPVCRFLDLSLRWSVRVFSWQRFSQLSDGCVESIAITVRWTIMGATDPFLSSVCCDLPPLVEARLARLKCLLLNCVFWFSWCSRRHGFARGSTVIFTFAC